jgi:chromosome partitioning protein
MARPHIIVLGNEKGGTGKSTTALHLIVALLRRGFTVGSIDLDARQGTLSRGIENRQAFAERKGVALPMPDHRRIFRIDAEAKSVAEWKESKSFERALKELAHKNFILIDTPGSDNYLSRLGHANADTLITLSRLGHANADTLITPLNDSYLDLDLLARIDVAGRKILGPSLYSQMVWEQRQQRAAAGRRPTDWIVMRNRLSHIDARNKREVGNLLDMLAKRIQFRLVPGFGERVVFRELFPMGLTLLDLPLGNEEIQFSVSHLAAKQEVRALLQAIGLPEQTESAPGPGEAEQDAEEPPRLQQQNL